jgi:hypothetical protein
VGNNFSGSSSFFVWPHDFLVNIVPILHSLIMLSQFDFAQESSSGQRQRTAELQRAGFSERD